MGLCDCRTNMRKAKFLLMGALLFSICAYGQTDDRHWKKKYLNIGFVNTSFNQEGTPQLKSNYGASLTVGRTFYLHKKPIANILKFGIDATWFDINYTNYDVTHITYWNTNKFQIHEGEIGMQVGPSLTINPISKMNIHVYFRYAPSFSCFYADDEFQGGYATYIVGGGSLTYSFFGLGLEWRHGTSKFDSLLNWSNVSENIETKTNGIRAYITFKF